MGLYVALSLKMLCHYAEWRVLFIMLNGIMLTVVILIVVVLNVIMLTVVILIVIMLNVIMLSVVMLNVILLSVVASLMLILQNYSSFRLGQIS
jgi:hypothetical protein